ncbi:hypothetical protein ACFU8W_42900, partial [Streptomyces sp. NPDC057565]|uniref:hypothetical protein n=1 Tax=Streptomyces sp. NPDC057565 TaxID=3346169 RepID=UPI00368A8DA7
PLHVLASHLVLLPLEPQVPVSRCPRSRGRFIKDGGSDFANCETCGGDAVVGVRTAASPDTDSYICFSCGADCDGICGYCGSGGHLVMEDMCDNCYEIRLAKF